MGAAGHSRRHLGRQAPVSFNRTLAPGAQGPDVVELQLALNELGFDVGDKRTDGTARGPGGRAASAARLRAARGRRAWADDIRAGPQEARLIG